MNPGDFPARTPVTAAPPLGAGAWKTTVCAERGHREPHLASAASFSRNAKKKRSPTLHSISQNLSAQEVVIKKCFFNPMSLPNQDDCLCDSGRLGPSSGLLFKAEHSRRSSVVRPAAQRLSGPACLVMLLTDKRKMPHSAARRRGCGGETAESRPGPVAAPLRTSTLSPQEIAGRGGDRRRVT